MKTLSRNTSRNEINCQNNDANISENCESVSDLYVMFSLSRKFREMDSAISQRWFKQFRKNFIISIKLNILRILLIKMFYFTKIRKSYGSRDEYWKKFIRTNSNTLTSCQKISKQID